jgi:hypothetical protein
MVDTGLIRFKYVGLAITFLGVALLLVDCGGRPNAMPAPNDPSTLYNTSGGGFATSSNYRARISIGAPAPMGSASSSGLLADVGPNPR